MDNGELFRLLTEQFNGRMDRLEVSINRYFDNQSIVCKDHDTRIDQHEKLFAIISDRQEQAEVREKKLLTIIGISIPVVSSIISFLWQKLKL